MALGKHGQLTFSLQKNQCEAPLVPDFGLGRDDRCMTDGNTPRKANAVIFMLSKRDFYDIRLAYDYPPARNIDLQGAINSMGRLEDRFNKKFGYPYVFLNDEPFNEEFRM
jgi:hypothetical protein